MENQEQFEVVSNEADDLQSQETPEPSASLEVETPKESDNDKEAVSKDAPDAGEEKPEVKAEAKPDEVAPKKEEAKPKTDRFQKRINTLTKRQKEAETRAEEAEAKLEKLEKANSANDEPDPNDYDEYNDYLKDLGKYDLAQKEAEKETPKVDKELENAVEDIKDAFDTPELFEESVKIPDLIISRDMVLSIRETENPADIVKYLGKNVKEAARIAKLSPIGQAREIGKLEVIAANAPPELKKKTTESPEPIKPVGGTDVSKKKIEDMTFNEYEEHKRAKQAGKKGFW